MIKQCLSVFLKSAQIAQEKKMMWCHGTPGRNEVPSANVEWTQIANSLVYVTVAPAHVCFIPRTFFHGFFLTVLLSHLFEFGRAAKSLSPPSLP
ncbi:unnamed protein product [Chilo suppressalis]|uniref:Uncharacterized protein n=1 Tax=Chilo suppressalis TaxID=168631 RepID=A0ABN8BGL7_CHISP|nr:unnamed protein product [Chilo suppressalis]